MEYQEQIASLERRRHELHKEFLEMERLADEMVETYLQATVAMGTLNLASTYFQGTFSCNVGLLIATIMVVIFILWFVCLSIITYGKLKRLDSSVEEFNGELKGFHVEVSSLKQEIDPQRSESSSTDDAATSFLSSTDLQASPKAIDISTLPLPQLPPVPPMMSRPNGFPPCGSPSALSPLGALSWLQTAAELSIPPSRSVPVPVSESIRNRLANLERTNWTLNMTFFLDYYHSHFLRWDYTGSFNAVLYPQESLWQKYGGIACETDLKIDGS